MTKSRRALILGVVLTAVVALGCGPDKGPDVADMASIVFKIEATGSGQINIVIDATDQFGSHGTAAETGLPYPLNVQRRAPYTHTIYIQPGLVITGTITAYLLSKDKDEIISCEVIGPDGTLKDKLVQPGNKPVNCRYVTGVPGVPAFKEPPK